MAPRRIVPPNQQLKKWFDAGLTQRQMIDEIEKLTGERVSRSAVAVALHRAGLTKVEHYHDEIPWTVSVEHSRKYDVTMLRIRARMKRGLPVTAGDRARYGAWLRRLYENNVVLAYNKDWDEGFRWVDRDPARDAAEDIVRRPKRRVNREVLVS